MAATRDRVEKVLEMVRPALQMDGGDLQLLEWDPEEGVATIRFVGACGGCPMSQMTLQHGIEHALKQRVEGFTGVAVETM